MKIVLTGGTGFVGGEVLVQLLDNPRVELITCLTRKPIPIQNAKLATVLCEDFTQFNDQMASSLLDHEACIWALGAKSSDVSDLRALQWATYDFALTFAKSMASVIERNFCMCYLSGMGADRSETAPFFERDATSASRLRAPQLQMLSPD